MRLPQPPHTTDPFMIAGTAVTEGVFAFRDSRSFIILNTVSRTSSEKSVASKKLVATWK